MNPTVAFVGRRLTTPRRLLPRRLGTTSLPARQRAALAWRLRDALARADLRAARYAEWPTLRETVRVDNLRGEILAVIADLESGRER